MTSDNIYVYFIDTNGEPMFDIKLDGSPDFIEGRTLFLTIKNQNPDIWNVENFPKTAFKIVKVEYDVEVHYYSDKCSSPLVIYVYLEKLDKQDEL